MSATIPMPGKPGMTMELNPGAPPMEPWVQQRMIDRMTPELRERLDGEGPPGGCPQM